MTSPTPSFTQVHSSLVINPTSTACPKIPAPSGKIASAWWPDYHNSNVTWDKYNHLMYSFAIPSLNGSVTLPTLGWIPGVTNKFMDAAHNQNPPIPVSVTVGGWTGSGNFSNILASADLRSTFISELSNLVNTYCFDGLDFDWEYPAGNGSGLATNAWSLNDTGNFLTFFQELRANPATSNLILTAATPIHPWNNATIQPLTNVTEFAEVLDWIQIMNYDHQLGSGVSAVAKWTAAGMPANKIVLGVGAYGHSYGYNQSIFTPYANSTSKSHGDKWADPTGDTRDFFSLIDGGFLTESGKPMDGIQYVFDNCSQTAYVYDKTTQVVVSFDDAHAFEAKGQFIADRELRGFAIWEAGSDNSDMLLDAIRKTSMGN
ncbi:glycoside hydrolase family 18 protein [Sphaerobolus stellatus SS14]|uniref:Glycoside hydrolase family 18 protein n=1 Tax=Sphaerobolus stellatus (strain SS14) TaxID=990650 RepID=A0A0C9TSZ0_SPHS4|nr:glycoside hydrolase family 18 protein [Sphaerobolus stellatus SS14]